MEQKNEEGYLINQELEKDNKDLRKRSQELNDTIAKQNMQLESLHEKIDELNTNNEIRDQQIAYNYGLYQQEWMICEQLTKNVQELTNKLKENSDDTLSRKFLMKTQLQIIRRKDKELKEFAKRINQLKDEIDGYKLLTDQWQYPDIMSAFSPETMGMFDKIVKQCETNREKTENDNNPDIEINDQDIKMLSEYLSFNDTM